MLIDRNKNGGSLRKNVIGTIDKVEQGWVKVRYTMPSKEGYQYDRIMVQRQEFTCYGTRYYREGLPLRLAFTTTVHAAQGRTVDRLITMLNKKVFEMGQGYVAGSRVTGLSRCSGYKDSISAVQFNNLNTAYMGA